MTTPPTLPLSALIFSWYDILALVYLGVATYVVAAATKKPTQKHAHCKKLRTHILGLVFWAWDIIHVLSELQKQEILITTFSASVKPVPVDTLPSVERR